MSEVPKTYSKKTSPEQTPRLRQGDRLAIVCSAPTGAPLSHLNEQNKACTRLQNDPKTSDSKMAAPLTSSLALEAS